MAKAENHGAHVHGLATLMLTLENEVLEIQFESPAANLIGFEHKADSLEEKQKVTQTAAVLKSPDLFFSFDGTNCQSKKTSVDISGVMNDENGQHEHHNHSKDHDDDNHSEIKTSYRFICKNGTTLNSISISLFNLFPGIEKINAMWVTENRQGAELLSLNNNTIYLR